MPFTPSRIDSYHYYISPQAAQLVELYYCELHYLARLGVRTSQRDTRGEAALKDLMSEESEASRTKPNFMSPS